MVRLQSLQSAPITAKATDTLVPAQVLGLGYTVEQGKVILTWDAVTTNTDGSAISDLAGYKVFRKKTNADVYEAALGQTAADEATFTDESMQDGSSYVYAVLAFDTEGGEGDKSADKDVKTIPSVPTGLASVASEGQIALTWASVRDALTPEKNENLAGYTIYKAVEGGTLEILADVDLVEGAEVLEFVDENVVAGATYEYAISSFDNSL